VFNKVLSFEQHVMSRPQITDAPNKDYLRRFGRGNTMSDYKPLVLESVYNAGAALRADANRDHEQSFTACLFKWHRPRPMLPRLQAGDAPISISLHNSLHLIVARAAEFR
jgi:hypothetical protein